MVYKFSLIGTHSTGKTTTAFDIVTHFKKEGYNVELVSETIRNCPFPINQSTTLKSQKWVMSKQILEELNAEVGETDLIICDRSIIDPVIYAQANNLDTSGMLDNLVEGWVDTYNHFFYLKKKKELLDDDGFRDTDIEFWEEIDKRFKNYIDENGLNDKTTFTYSLSNSIISKISRYLK